MAKIKVKPEFQTGSERTFLRSVKIVRKAPLSMQPTMIRLLCDEYGWDFSSFADAVEFPGITAEVK